MDFSEGIAPESQTLVVVPTLIDSAQNVEDLVEALEVRFLANRDDRLHFALLTDFADAHEETLPQDDAAAGAGRAAHRRAEREVPRCRRRGDDDIFFLFHRPRRWNPRERVWMGYERKRGKLGDLNALLRGGAAAPFSRIVGRIAGLVRRALRHHAGHRHAAAARRGAPAGRHDGASAQSRRATTPPAGA